MMREVLKHFFLPHSVSGTCCFVPSNLVRKPRPAIIVCAYEWPPFPCRGICFVVPDAGITAAACAWSAAAADALTAPVSLGTGTPGFRAYQ